MGKQDSPLWFQKIQQVLPLKRVLSAHGLCPPPPEQATITRGLRLVTCLDGQNIMEYPQGNSIQQDTLTPGEAILIPFHSWNRPLHLVNHEFITLEVRDDYIRYYWRWHPVDPQMSPRQECYLFYGPRHPLLHPLVTTCDVAAKTLIDPSILLALSNTLIRLLLIIYEQSVLNKEIITSIHYRWLEILEYIETNLHQHFSRETIAYQFHIHPSHLSRLCRKQTGETFRTLIRRKRMELAAHLLGYPELTIKEIGFRCGFSDLQHFYHVFNEFYGQTPGQYRLYLSKKAGNM